VRTLYLVSVGLHLLAAATWIGSLTFFGAVLVPALRAPDLEPIRARVLTVVGLRYRLVGWIALAVLVVTGTTNLWLRGVSWRALSGPAFWASPWARVLAWKLALVALLIVVNLVHDVVLGPRAARLLELDPQSEDASRARRSASRLGRLELVISVAVLGLAVLLVRGLP
jgi:putative copper export protein